MKFKKIISLAMAVITLFSLFVVAFAKDEKSKITFSKDDACQVAVTAAKSKIITEGFKSETADKVKITKMKYLPDSKQVMVTLRADNRHKYICYISIKNVFGSELGFIADSQYKTTNVVFGFFGGVVDSIGYWFIRLFHKDTW